MTLSYGVAWTHPFWFGARRPRFKNPKKGLKVRVAPFYNPGAFVLFQRNSTNSAQVYIRVKPLLWVSPILQSLRMSKFELSL